MSADGFKPHGAMSQRDACLVVFRTLAVGEWIAGDQLVARVRELTGVECIPESVHGAAWSAREQLATNNEVGVESYLTGYKRLTVDGQIQAVDRRVRRFRRAGKRTIAWTGAALANPEVTGADRIRMERIRSTAVRQNELDERRALRRRPAD